MARLGMALGCALAAMAAVGALILVGALIGSLAAWLGLSDAGTVALVLSLILVGAAFVWGWTYDR